jgi:NDP-sugar pyrophosphorylase family protein
MDTGGAVANAVKELRLSGDFLVTNADTWLGAGIFELIKSNSPSIGLVNLENVSRYGQVQYDHNKKVISFNEKSNSLASGWINAGISKLSPALFNVCDGLPFSLERKLFVELIQLGELNAVPLNSDFLDIGIPSDYSRFCNWVASGRKGSI